MIIDDARRPARAYWLETDGVYGMGKRAVAVDIQTLGEALDWHDEMGASWYLDLETGESFLYFEDGADEEMGEALEADPERYRLIEPRESSEGYRDMEDFARTVRDPVLVGKLEVALNGRGVFRRFKDVLTEYPKERERWFEFKNRRLEDAAREWLEANDIDPVPRPKGDRATAAAHLADTAASSAAGDSGRRRHPAHKGR